MLMIHRVCKCLRREVFQILEREFKILTDDTLDRSEHPVFYRKINSLVYEDFFTNLTFQTGTSIFHVNFMNSSHNFVTNLSKSTELVSVSFQRESVGSRADRGLALAGGEHSLSVVFSETRNKGFGGFILTLYKTAPKHVSSVTAQFNWVLLEEKKETSSRDSPTERESKENLKTESYVCTGLKLISLRYV